LGDLEHGAFIESMDVHEEVKKKVFADSALEFLGIELQSR
jgi:hypothetical protein